MSGIDLNYFEDIICYKSLTDETYLASIIDYIKPFYFKDKNISSIFKIITEFFEKRGVRPTLTEIKSYLTTDELKSSFRTVVGRFKDIDQNINLDELINNTEIFLKEKAVYYTMTDVVDVIGKQGVNTTDILEKFEKACSISLTSDLGVDLFRDIDRVIHDLKNDSLYIPTKWKWLDDKLGGGLLQNGRALYLFAGETNIGKSIFLGNIAANIANQGKTVLVVTLEMPEMLYARRIASNITKISINNLRDESPTLKQQIEMYAVENPDGRIIIKEFPPSTITCNHLRAFIKKLANKGIKIDCLVLDYLNLLMAPQGANSYERIKYNTEQLRALSYIFNFPIVSATQLNRSATSTSNPGLETISESMGTAMTADVITSIWQEESDKELGIINIGMMKNRFGPNFGKCAMRIDYSTLSLTEDVHLNDTESSQSSMNTLQKLEL